ncbi:MAG: SpoIID/LytB domain-containing protein [Candidatus Omnitrophica bacterium]|nr:SpoIID/LytB domain-containing protein [Candidatus Omnitrophota bacterium]
MTLPHLSLWVVSFLLLGSNPLWAMGNYPLLDESRSLRVAVVNGEKSVSLKVLGPYEIRQLHTGVLLKEGRSLETVLTPEPEGIRLGEESLKLYGVRIIPKREAAISLGGRRFRGRVDILRQADTTLLIVNHLDIEEYLYGVLPHEVPHHWSEEMLEVQAILARTYALFKKVEHQNEDYDVKATVLSQVYGGREEEKRRARRAVDRTAGKILTYQGTLFPTFYHSTCGGQTEDAVVAGLWKISLFPLHGGVRCTTCGHSPFYRWKRSFSLEDIAYRLRKAGYAVKKVVNLHAEDKTASGRVKTMVVESEDTVLKIPATAFRLAISPTDLRSVKFDLTVREGKVTFEGFGWGHGAGLCQWGANEMAERGFSIEEILTFYYPGSEIRDLPNIPWHKK